MRVAIGVIAEVSCADMDASRDDWAARQPSPLSRGAHHPSLPLDGARGLAGDVEGDPVDLADLVGDAGGDALQHVVRQPGPVGGHGVLGGDRAEHDGVAVGAAVALDADRADVGEQHDRHLPDVAVEAGAGELLAGDGVGLAQDVEALAGDLADDPDAEAGPGERLAPHHRGREAELLADQADLVLEERAQRLDQLELEVVGQAADVVVGLDVGGAGAAAGLDDVGVERALDEVRRVAAPSAASPKTRTSAASKVRMNSRPMILRFSSGSHDPLERAEELVARRRRRRGLSKTASKSRRTCSVSPRRIIPWSTYTQVSRSPMARCTIAAATAESTPPDSAQIARPLADLLADRLDLLLDDVEHRPGLAAAGDVVQEVLEHLLAVLGVQHLGVPLDAGQAAPDVLEGRDRGDRRSRPAR